MFKCLNIYINRDTSCKRIVFLIGWLKDGIEWYLLLKEITLKTVCVENSQSTKYGQKETVECV